METKEYILCAAIWIRCNKHKQFDGQPSNIRSGYVIAGRRHSDCFATYRAFLNSESDVYLNNSDITYPPLTQGFITSTNRFVNRMAAGHIAFRSGQIKEDSDYLISEDLY